MSMRAKMLTGMWIADERCVLANDCELSCHFCGMSSEISNNLLSYLGHAESYNGDTTSGSYKAFDFCGGG